MANKEVTKKKTTNKKVNKSKTVNKKANTSSKSSNKAKSQKNSATMRAYERRKKLENTQSLAGLTAELPRLGINSLDGPDIRPWKNIRLPKIELNLNTHKIIRTLALVFVLITVAIAVLINVFRVDNVLIEGNSHYSNEAIYNMVIGDNPIAKSSVYLSLKYSNRDIEDIPFIQTLNVKIISRDTVKIIVYEKAMAGYIEYLGRYFYFDKDGTIVESSDARTKGIPQVLGLDFDHVVLYEKLPVDDEEIFKEILEISQLLGKYGIEADKLMFDRDLKATLYFGDSRVKLGGFDNIDEKIIRLKAILPELNNRKGVLRMENFDGTNDIITFELDKE